MTKVVKGTGSILQDAIPFSKGKQKLFKGALGLEKPKVDTSAQDAALEQQRFEQAKLDEEENRRRKRLFAGATGPRAYSGSPLFRRAPSNTAGAAVSSGGSQVTSRTPRIAQPRGGGRYATP